MPVAIIEVVLSVAAIIGGAVSILSRLFSANQSIIIKSKKSNKSVEVQDLDKADLKKLVDSLS